MAKVVINLVNYTCREITFHSQLHLFSAGTLKSLMFVSSCCGSIIFYIVFYLFFEFKSVCVSACLCVTVCMCVCMSVCLCVSVSVYLCVCVSARGGLRKTGSRQTGSKHALHTQTQTHTHTDTHTHAHTHTHVQSGTSCLCACFGKRLVLSASCDRVLLHYTCRPFLNIKKLLYTKQAVPGNTISDALSL